MHTPERFRIGWRAKAFAYAALDVMPFGSFLYRQLQRHVTRTIPRQLAPTARTASDYLRGIEAIRSHSHAPIAGARFLEFGAGWDLYGNLLLWCYGVNDQVALDLRRLASADQVNHVIRHLEADPPPNAVRIPARTLTESARFGTELRDVYGIHYLAPADAANTGLPGGSVDIITTTSVLEHVPFEQLRPILAECRRLMHDRSVMNHVIDYSDHYAHSDASITQYNFLRFDESEWRRFNPAIHYQNRARHSEYRALFVEAGFQVVDEHAEQPEDGARLLASVALAGRFRDMSTEALAPTSGQFILRKADR